MAATQTKDKTLLLIDSHALIHRAFHAFPIDLKTKDGEVVNAVYGYARLMLDVLTKFKPSHVVAIFDAPGGTFRTEMYGAYKANRSAPDDLLIGQIPRIEELLTAFNIPILRVVGYEADDLIGTIDDKHSGEWAQTIIVTGDRDLFQLVDEDTFVYLAGSQFSQSQLYDREGVIRKMELAPEFITDLKAIHGDTSDNIPGVYGIGEKGAKTLINQFGHLEDIYAHIAEIKGKTQEKLIENQELAFLSKKLATIERNAPLSFNLTSAEFGSFSISAVEVMFKQMEFNSLLSKVRELSAKYGTVPQAEQLTIQQGLSFPPQNLTKWTKQSIAGEKVFAWVTFNKPADPFGIKPESLTFTTDQSDTSYYVDFADLPDFAAMIKDKWLISNDIKNFQHALANLHLDQQDKTWDLGIVTYILSRGRFKPVVAEILQANDIYDFDDTDPNPEMFKHAYQQQVAKVGEDQKLAKLLSVENKLVKVIVNMERCGVRLDTSKIAKDDQKLTSELADIEQKIYHEVGHEFNVASPKQVGEVLFVEKGLPSGKKTKSGGFSTDERILRELVTVDPVVEQILNYREISKLLSTYVKALPEYVNPETGKIHASFNQIGAITGRFSSQNPNLQNLPLGETFEVNLRDSFISDPGAVFISADYSQQELRLLAELSREEAMQDAFRENRDIHALTAAEVFEIPIEQVTKEQRKVGKTINFGVVYGISGFGLADRLKIDPRKANDFIKKYFETYPKIKEYYAKLISDAKQQGFVETILGRKRNTDDLLSPNFQLRAGAEREIMNFPLQGSAADMMKLAMVEIGQNLTSYPADLIMQIHDELVFEYRTDLGLAELQKDPKFIDFIQAISQTMKQVIKLSVPLEVGVRVGKTLGSMSEIEI